MAGCAPADISGLCTPPPSGTDRDERRRYKLNLRALDKYKTVGACSCSNRACPALIMMGVKGRPLCAGASGTTRSLQRGRNAPPILLAG